MRRGRVVGGIVLLLATAALCAPYAFAAGGSAVDQGYPCATAPPSAPGSNGSSGNTKGTCGSQSIAGVSHTQTSASPQTVGEVAPAQHTGGTLPFTGLQLGVFVALGVLLIGGGLVLRASGRKRTDL